MIQRTYQDFFEDILEAIIDISNFIDDLVFDEFTKDKKTINAVIRSLEIIGEASKKVSQEIKDNNQNIPWKEMAGMRDKIIHGYFDLDLVTIWETVKNDIPPLKPLFENLLK
ncbi:MAG: DUF86 domain-containing protein [Candidatus Cloacimonetes bacterium]|nr:DUF86 domain-containing protein [Candidatus Cloacimonadota bacterium]MBL7149100.1 DUF86 domain-containing protein [Candidatus Cloacimonadota bacterium]